MHPLYAPPAGYASLADLIEFQRLMVYTSFVGTALDLFPHPWEHSRPLAISDQCVQC